MRSSLRLRVPARAARALFGVALVLLLAPGVGAADEGDRWRDATAALRVDVKTKAGVRYAGLVRRTPAMVALFSGEEAPDLAEAPGTARIAITGFNGLSGSITLKVAEIASVEVTEALDREALDEATGRSAAAKEDRWVKENARLAKIAEARAAKAAAAAAATLEVTGALPELSEAAAEWVGRYPPEEGWVPAKKAQLYYQTVVLDNRPLTDDERVWLDNYDAWKLAYDEWLVREQARISLEADAPVGPSGATSGSAAASVDPSADGQAGAGLPAVDPVAPPKGG